VRQKGATVPRRVPGILLEVSRDRTGGFVERNWCVRLRNVLVSLLLDVT
jgi:hypothetical protein